MTKEEFILECSKLNINITNDILEKLDTYKSLLQEWNKKFNLTNILEDNDIYLKHFYDSICFLKYIDIDNKNVCDFGTGAGFPGMVLAILKPNSQITLMEANNKKTIFLEAVKNDLKLQNVTIICDRAETYGKNNREIFDIITCRAVSNLGMILELSSSMLKVNGIFAPMKSNITEEYEKAKKYISELSYKLNNKFEYDIPKENAKRTILEFEKISKTKEKYPRNYNVIKKQYN